ALGGSRMKFAVAVSFCLLAYFVVLHGQGGVGLVFYEFEPGVVRAETARSVIFHTAIAGSPTRVVLEPNRSVFPASLPAGDIEMRDDGLNGDQRAGDGVYSVTLDLTEAVKALQPEDVFRKFIGFVKPIQGTTEVLRGNVFVPIITNDLPQ